MDIDFQYLSMDDLVNMYMKADKELKTALINGENWTQVSDKRRIYTELSMALNRRRDQSNAAGSPAEGPTRKH